MRPNYRLERRRRTLDRWWDQREQRAARDYIDRNVCGVLDDGTLRLRSGGTALYDYDGDWVVSDPTYVLPNRPMLHGPVECPVALLPAAALTPLELITRERGHVAALHHVLRGQRVHWLEDQLVPKTTA